MLECRPVDAIDMDRSGALRYRVRHPEKEKACRIGDRTDHAADEEYSSKIDRKMAQDHRSTACRMLRSLPARLRTRGIVPTL